MAYLALVLDQRVRVLRRCNDRLFRLWRHRVLCVQGQ